MHESGSCINKPLWCCFSAAIQYHSTIKKGYRRFRAAGRACLQQRQTRSVCLMNGQPDSAVDCGDRITCWIAAVSQLQAEQATQPAKKKSLNTRNTARCNNNNKTRFTVFADDGYFQRCSVACQVNAPCPHCLICLCIFKIEVSYLFCCWHKYWFAYLKSVCRHTRK